MTASRCKALRTVAWQCGQEEEESPDVVNRGAGDGGGLCNSTSFCMAFRCISQLQSILLLMKLHRMAARVKQDEVYRCLICT